MKNETTEPSRCQLCGRLAPTKQVNFNQNIGLVAVRRYSYVKGQLCKDCINKEFTRKTLTTLFMGWWGLISMFITPIYLLGNIVSFLPTIGMKKE